ncbi:MAG: lysophospholipid acyltransferase family protein [Hungatella sp.]
MNRIAFMVVRHLFQVPIWFYKVNKMGKHKEKYPEKERYDYLRKIVKQINSSGRIHVSAHGVENIPEKESFILFPNHQGLFDMLALIDTCPRPLGAVVKKEVANVILVKQVVNLLDGISMDRSDLRSSMEVIQKMTQEVKNGRNYAIFAEGTRSRNGNRILEFKAGTFKSAVKAKCPIIPVALIDSYKPFDVSSIKKEEVQVCYLAPLYPDQYMGLTTKEIADIVHDRIQEEIDKNKW